MKTFKVPKTCQALSPAGIPFDLPEGVYQTNSDDGGFTTVTVVSDRPFDIRRDSWEQLKASGQAQRVR